MCFACNFNNGCKITNISSRARAHFHEKCVKIDTAILSVVREWCKLPHFVE